MESVGRHRDIACGVGGFGVLDAGKGELAGSAGRDWGPKDGDDEDQGGQDGDEEAHSGGRGSIVGGTGVVLSALWS